MTRLRVIKPKMTKKWDNDTDRYGWYYVITPKEARWYNIIALGLITTALTVGIALIYRRRK
jgi:hypothetical protein